MAETGEVVAICMDCPTDIRDNDPCWGTLSGRFWCETCGPLFLQRVPGANLFHFAWGEDGQLLPVGKEAGDA